MSGFPGPTGPTGRRGTHVRAGTSGFAFPEWRGAFYPADLAADRFLSYYATQLPTVEVNSTFYRMPSEETLRAWAEQTPPGFLFAVKAHRRITHVKRLRDVDAELRWTSERLGALQDRLGAVLFQCPPSLKCDLHVLEQFLAASPPLPRVAAEFRHPTWFQEGTYELLRRYRVALCVGEDEDGSDPLVWTAPFGYLRLHRLRYEPDQLRTWAARLREAPVAEVFCYFTHDAGPRAVAFARTLMELCAAEPEPGAVPPR